MENAFNHGLDSIYVLPPETLYIYIYIYIWPALSPLCLEIKPENDDIDLGSINIHIPKVHE